MPEDQYHAQAEAIYRLLRRTREPMVTSDSVLGETITFLFGRTSSASEIQFLDAVLTRIARGGLLLESVTADRFQQAWELRKRYQDKPDISFTDFTLIAIMQTRRIVRIFSGDHHFVQVNLGFQLVDKVPSE